ncbi:UDP-glucosyltransferase 2-like isoform X2 [Diabrotica virgifera virgifera]|uniref:UDP-glucuronosyltransferase n=1 Tax=Diabrotica virgifera virgifera TaxID=50390 RepID=A0ABM5IGE4_DIAVI|nr:UDP-glucosyltransferase 2-like isoform X2 [Diabrotica virgifera virgifera]
MFQKVLCLCLLTIVIQTDSARILVLIPTPAISHQSALRPLWTELSLRGHSVTLATTNVANDSRLVNLTEIDMGDMYTNPQLLSLNKKMSSASNFEVLHLINKICDTLLDSQLSTHLKHLIRNESLFDVVIAEHIIIDQLAFADLYGCPKIVVSSFDVTSLVHSYVGNPSNLVAHPDFNLALSGGKLSFKERMASFIYVQIYYAYKLLVSYPTRTSILKKHFGENVRSSEEYYKDIDLLLLNVNPILNEPRPLGPNVITFGGAIHVSQPKPLPKDLQDYLDSATEGCIYFSLGSNTKSAFMGEKKIKIIMEALGELPYKVLWKFEDEGVVVPKNIKLVSWVPQQDVLRHPNIKVFVTQCGMQSLEEAVVNHVPMVMMPMYGDQEANAKRMELKGIAKIVPHKPLPDKESFKSAIIEVITNPSYKQNIIKIAELLLDTPMTGVEKAVWWIEYVIRHKGAKHLRVTDVDVPFYQYYCLDVIATLSLVVYIFFKVICIVLRALKKLVCRKSKVDKNNNKKIKKNN